MATKDDIEDIEEDIEEPTQEELEEAEDEIETDAEETKEDAMEEQQELMEDYGSPQPEEKYNPHVIISKALGNKDTVRTTFLTESELGRPLFSVRFLLDLHDDALRDYVIVLNNEHIPFKMDRIAAYYYEKIQNITGSGMSNKGFTMNLNVTQKRDTTRRRVREVPKEGEVKK